MQGRADTTLPHRTEPSGADPVGHSSLSGFRWGLIVCMGLGGADEQALGWSQEPLSRARLGCSRHARMSRQDGTGLGRTGRGKQCSIDCRVEQGEGEPRSEPRVDHGLLGRLEWDKPEAWRPATLGTHMGTHVRVQTCSEGS